MRGSRLVACAAVTIALSSCGEKAVSVSTLTTVLPTDGRSATATVASRRVAKPAVGKQTGQGDAAGRAWTLARMVGQTIVGHFAGPSPPSSFLAQVRSGELGGVILSSENVARGPAATRRANDRLQLAAREGGNPPLLIMTDQEGGEVRRLSWAAPQLAASEMTSPAGAQLEGEATGRALRDARINVDLAPVADVVHVAGSFLRTRSFGSDPASVAERACAFAAGVESQGVAYTLKHFPGLGRALTSTDVRPTTVAAPAAALRRDFAPYRACGNTPDALVMISSAIYPSLTGSPLPAVLAPAIYSREIPTATGGEPVTISDDLQAGALANEIAPAQRAIDAGLDLVLYAQTQRGAHDAFRRLLQVARAGGIPRARLEQADRAVGTLKEHVAGASRTATPSKAEAAAYPESVGAPETVAPDGRSAK
jgi:beta-N-acetylhexosaminidase